MSFQEELEAVCVEQLRLQNVFTRLSTERNQVSVLIHETSGKIKLLQKQIREQEQKEKEAEDERSNVDGDNNGSNNGNNTPVNPEVNEDAVGDSEQEQPAIEDAD